MFLISLGELLKRWGAWMEKLPCLMVLMGADADDFALGMYQRQPFLLWFVAFSSPICELDFP